MFISSEKSRGKNTGRQPMLNELHSARRKIKASLKYMDFVESIISFFFLTLVDLSIFLSGVAFWSCIRSHISGWSVEASVGTVNEKYPLNGSWVLRSLTDCPAELTPAHTHCPAAQFPSVLWSTGVVCVRFYGEHLELPGLQWGCSEGTRGSGCRNGVTDCLFSACCCSFFSREASVGFASGYEIVEVADI